MPGELLARERVLAPLPLTWPGVSWANVYSGLPPTTTCLVPSGPRDRARAGQLGLPGRTGFQIATHAPVQRMFDALSPAGV